MTKEKTYPQNEQNFLSLGWVLTSYVCHELSSPISALLTGLDILKPQSAEEKELVLLLQKSADSLRERLEFFRMAYGLGGKSLSLKDTHLFLENFFKLKENLMLYWSLSSEDGIKFAGLGQLILSLVLWCSKKSLSGGIYVIFNALDSVVEISIKSPSIFVRSTEESILLGENHIIDSLDSENAPVYLISHLLKALDRRLNILKPSKEEFKIQIQ